MTAGINGTSKNHRVTRKGTADTEATQGTTKKALRLGHTRAAATTASEEEVFARLVQDEVERLKTSDQNKSFQALIEKQIRVRTRDDGFVNWEKVGKGALKWAKKQNILSEDEATGIYSRCFRAAQSDSDDTTLFDSEGASTAVKERDSAFNDARVTLEKLASGTVEYSLRDLSEKSDSKTGGEAESVKNAFVKVKDLLDIPDTSTDSSDNSEIKVDPKGTWQI